MSTAAPEPQQAEEFAPGDPNFTPADSDVAVTTAVVRASGLPYSATEDDIRAFFTGFTVHAVIMPLPDKKKGRLNGNAFVQLDSPNAVVDAMDTLSKKVMGDRYVDLYPCDSQAVLEAWGRGRTIPIAQLEGHVVRVSGLPNNASAVQLLEYFNSDKVVHGHQGVVFVYTAGGRPTGVAYVVFQEATAATDALLRSFQAFGSYNLELAASSKADMLHAIAHPPTEYITGQERVNGERIVKAPAAVAAAFGGAASHGGLLAVRPAARSMVPRIAMRVRASACVAAAVQCAAPRVRMASPVCRLV